MLSVQKELEGLGLSEKEAKIYLALLEFGENTAHHLSKRAKLNRPTAYLVLESLIKKGLCSKYSKKDIAYYVPENPSNLDLLLAVQKQEIEHKQTQLKSVIEQLKTVHGLQKKDKQFVKFFEGKKGLLASRNEILESEDKLVRMIYPLKGYMNIYSDIERREAHSRRVNNQVKAKILYTRAEFTIDNDHTREAREVDSSRFPLSADIALYDGKVRIASLNSKLSGIVIDDPEIYKTFVSLFELAWQGAGQVTRD